MSSLTINGVAYAYPDVGSENWGAAATAWATAVSSHLLQKTGGTFTLSAEVNFGGSYGLKSLYLKSQAAANPSTAGVLRLGNNESVGWRNAANNADLLLKANASNKLEYNSIELADLSTAQTLTNKTISGSSNTLSNVGYSSLSLSNSILNSDINASAAIAYSKLNLSTSILNADISNSAAIAYSKLNLATSILNADINASAAIAYSKLNLSGSILNTDVNASAAIDRSKLASGTASHVLINDGSGVMSSEANLAISRGGTGAATATAAFNALSPSTTAGDLIVHNGTDDVRLPIGTDGQTVIVDTTQANKLKWATLPQGNKNYITYNNFENNAITGWNEISATYSSNTPSGTPTISASAAANLALSVTSTNPLAGTYSLQAALTAPSAGVGFCSDSLTIDREDRAKVLQGSFYYEVVSGSGNFSGTSSNTFSVWILDGASTWIQPAGVYNLVQSSGQGKCSFTFQTNSTTSTLRVVVFVNTSATITVNFDDFVLGPQVTSSSFSGPVGEIIATGSVTPPQGFLYCNGSAVSRTAYADLFSVIGTTYGVGDGSTTFNLPNASGLVLRGTGSQSISGRSKSGPSLGSTQEDQIQGHYHSINDPTHGHQNYYSGGAGGGTSHFVKQASSSSPTESGRIIGTTTGVTVTDPSSDGTNGTPRTGTETRVSALGVAYHIRYLKTYEMSNDTDTRIVAARWTKVSQSFTTGTETVISSVTSVSDTHSGLNTSSGVYTVPVSGYYRISAATASISTAWTASSNRYLQLRTGGSQSVSLGLSIISASITGYFGASGSTTLYYNAGDTISIFVNNYTGSTYQQSTTPIENWCSIERISGPATIAASESVNMRARASALTSHGTSGSSIAIAGWSAADFDTHGAFATTGIFTAPIAATYRVSATVSFAANAVGSRYLEVRKNTSAEVTLANQIASSSIGNILSGTCLVKCNAGDTIQLYAYQNSGGTLAYVATAQDNVISIEKV
jgi:microcystin-dependent protein